MIAIYVAQHQIRRATKLYDFKDIKNSITHGEKNLIGAIAEIVVCDYYRDIGYEVIHLPTKDYDMTINDVTVDVKCKTTNVAPEGHYSCMVADTSVHQNTQFYVFCRFDETNYILYILGRISKKEFFKVARHVKKGEKDEYEFEYTADCYWCRVDELHEVNY